MSREAPPSAVHDSPVARWRGAIARVMLCAVGFGVLLSLVGAFALDNNPVGIRTVYLVFINLVGAALEMVAYRISWRFNWSGGRFWHRVLLATLLAVVPIGLAVWGSSWLLGRHLPVSALLITFANAFVISGAFIAAFVAPAMDVVLKPVQPPPDIMSPAPRANHFMERLPARLRTAELWAVKAEDHYLSAVTASGETLIRLRMADALKELAAVEGAQTHRSWWVARHAVRGVRKGEGRIGLLLPDGREVPVSRAYARDLRAAGWI
jgi:LytTr DNA-binding domain